MGFMSRFRRKKTEERSSNQFSYGNFAITSYFGDGQTVSEAEALTIPTVAASVELITSSIASLPIYLYKQNADGEIQKVDDKRVFLLNNEPNPLINGYNFKKHMVKDFLFMVPVIRR